MASVEDEDVLNDDDEESEGDIHEIFQEQQDWKNGEEKIEPNNIGERPELSHGSEHLKNARKCPSSNSIQSKTSKCSTSFQRYRKKDVRGISIIHEMSRLIEVGEKLGYDAKGFH
ncbi:hypothetical protein Tco_0022202, partial [Tanacetum coccineum]